MLGVSPDDETSHVKFREKYELPFALLADADHQVAEDYGVWGEKTYYGQARTWASKRSTFVIDADGDGQARHARRSSPTTHADDVLATLRRG